MATRDLVSNVLALLAIAPGAGLTGTVNGEAIDTLDYDSIKFDCVSGATADVTSVTLEETDDDPTGSPTWTAVAADDYAPNAGPIGATTATDTVQSIGYRGVKRYVRVVLELNGATTYAVIANLGHAHKASVV